MYRRRDVGGTDGGGLSSKIENFYFPDLFFQQIFTKLFIHEMEKRSQYFHISYAIEEVLLNSTTMMTGNDDVYRKFSILGNWKIFSVSDFRFLFQFKSLN